MKIIITGGSGQVGQILARSFIASGDEVVVITRSASPGMVGRFVSWDGITEGAWVRELEGADVLINMAGRTVNCRYNATNRRQMLESRVRSTTVLREAIGRLASPPRVWLNASTATIYRHALDRPMDEATGELGGNEPGAPEKWNFSIEVAKQWEAAFFAGDLPGTRRVALRSAMTMSPDPGGVLDVMLGLVRKGLGGTNGSGRQYVSWIHDEDFVAAVRFLIERQDIDGAVNLASPNPLPNAEFMRTLREAWGVPVGLPATEWMLEIGAIFLRTETELILKSRRVIPGRLQGAGFRFLHPEWAEAARDLCARVRQRSTRR
ncbi:TIGR01777 family protein [bacterium]|nr:TIGR01777 family protein [bacterium]